MAAGDVDNRPAKLFVNPADVAHTRGGFFLLELNTFGAMWLYAWDLDAVVRVVSPNTR